MADIWPIAGLACGLLATPDGCRIVTRYEQQTGRRGELGPELGRFIEVHEHAVDLLFIEPFDSLADYAS